MLDEQIIQGCQKGDPLAQRQLYDRVSGKMMGVCLRYMKDEEEAKDLLQEGFIIIFQQIKNYRGEVSLEGLLKKIFVNAALTKIRKRKLSFQSLPDDEWFDSNNSVTNNSMEAKDLLQLIKKMPEGYKVIFNLYAIEGFNHAEIGEKLGISAGTSKSQYARARQYLQKMLLEEKVK